jgi:hypothetical protein
MPLPKIAEARELNDERLAEEIVPLKDNYSSCACKKPPDN